MSSDAASTDKIAKVLWDHQVQLVDVEPAYGEFGGTQVWLCTCGALGRGRQNETWQLAYKHQAETITAALQTTAYHADTLIRMGVPPAAAAELLLHGGHWDGRQIVRETRPTSTHSQDHSVDGQHGTTTPGRR